jgi:hypothetical protein
MVKAVEWQGMVEPLVFVLQKLKDDFSTYEHQNCDGMTHPYDPFNWAVQ